MSTLRVTPSGYDTGASNVACPAETVGLVGCPGRLTFGITDGPGVGVGPPPVGLADGEADGAAEDALVVGLAAAVVVSPPSLDEHAVVPPTTRRAIATAPVRDRVQERAPRERDASSRRTRPGAGGAGRGHGLVELHQ